MSSFLKNYGSITVHVFMCFQCFSFVLLESTFKCNKENVKKVISSEIRLLPSVLNKYFNNLSKDFEATFYEDLNLDIIRNNSQILQFNDTIRTIQGSNFTSLRFPHFSIFLNFSKGLEYQLLENKLRMIARLFDVTRKKFHVIWGNYDLFAQTSISVIGENVTKLTRKLSLLEMIVHEDQKKANCSDFSNRMGKKQNKVETRAPKDCHEAFSRGNRKSGETVIQAHPSLEPQKVWCNHSWDGGGWTVILHRFQQKIQLDFRRSLSEYEDGFGIPEKEYWIGLKAMHYITNRSPNELLVFVSIPSETAFAKYENFRVGEPTGYELHVSGYHETSTAGNSLSYHNEMLFSTFDIDRDRDEVRSCSAHSGGGGFWFNFCYYANPTGVYPPQGLPKDTALNSMLEWRRWKGFHTYLSSLVMMIRPKNRSQQ